MTEIETLRLEVAKRQLKAKACRDLKQFALAKFYEKRVKELAARLAELGAEAFPKAADPADALIPQ
jgi:hypothetical protein